MKDKEMQNRDNKSKKKSKKSKRRNKFILFGVEIFLLLILVVGAAGVTKIRSLYDMMGKGDQFSDDTDAGINNGSDGIDSDHITVLEGYTNIAIFGLDNRSAGKYEKGLSDVIMIASINNKTKEVKLVSIYRDTYLNTDTGKYGKANTAYSRGGVKRAVQMLNTNLDLDIRKYVCVDWMAVVEAIDALGGVDVEVTKQEATLLNSYLWEIDKMTGQKTKQLEGYGKVTLNGAQATAYARIRKTAGNDFRRASRQRIVMEAMLNKAKKADIGTLLSLCETIFDDVSTNFTMNEILSLAKDVMSYQIATSAGFPYDLVTRNLNGSGDSVVPVDLANNVSKLHKVLFGVEDYKPSFVVETIGEAIMDKTGVDKNTTPYPMDQYDDISGSTGTGK